MNIIIFNWRDIRHPLAGGAEISLFKHAKYWVKRRANVIWFASSFKEGKKRENINGITMIRHGSHYTVHIYAFFYYLFGKLGKPDIVIDCFHFIPFFTPLYIQRIKIIGLINEVASNLWFSNLPIFFSIIGYHFESWFFKLYRRIIFITGSHSTKRELVEYGIHPRMIHVIHHGVYLSRISKGIKKEKNPTVIFLGRIARDKGIEDAIKAIASIRDNIFKLKAENIKFWIVGNEESDSYLAIIKKMVAEYGIDKRTFFFGYVDEKKKFELLKKAWVLVHPSIKEGWGLTVIEAASQGIPTVGYNVEGLRDSVLHGKTGILTDSNAKALADGMAKVLMNKKLYNTLSRHALEWSKNFNWGKSGAESWKLIHNIVDQK